MTNMTNLAVQRTTEKKNISYVDFAAHAAAKTAWHHKHILCLQHRYGFCLLMLCLVALAVGIFSSCTDLTALLVLLPFAVYLLITKQVLLYMPQHKR